MKILYDVAIDEQIDYKDLRKNEYYALMLAKNHWSQVGYDIGLECNSLTQVYISKSYLKRYKPIHGYVVLVEITKTSNTLMI